MNSDIVIAGKSSEKRLSEPIRDSIFISHRTVDSDVADMILDFLVACNIPRDKIFCSSLPGNDAEEQISPEVKQRLKEAAIIVLILSKAYYESAYCINEAGVAWYLDDVRAIPFGLPEINHGDMVGFLDSGYKLRRLDNEGDISYLYDQVQEKLDLATIKHSIVTQETKKLLKKYRGYIENNTNARNKETVPDEDIGVPKSYKSIVQAIIDAGGEVRSINEVVKRTGLSTVCVKKLLQQAIQDGSIEMIGAGRHRIYRIKNSDIIVSYTPIIEEIGATSKECDQAIVDDVDNDKISGILSAIHSYTNVNRRGSFSFDYSNNNGKYIIGMKEYQFTTQWSKASDKSIHAYNDSPDIDCIARVKAPCEIEENLSGEFDFSSRCRTPNIGDIIIWRNINGKFAATKILSICDDTRGADHDELTCEYVIYD